jgi:hypothetical protein
MPIATALSSSESVLAAKSYAARESILDVTGCASRNPEGHVTRDGICDPSCRAPAAAARQADSPQSALYQSTEYADYAAAVDRLRALELELRDANGEVVPTKAIEITDSEFLTELVRRELELELDESVPDDAYELDSGDALVAEFGAESYAPEMAYSADGSAAEAEHPEAALPEETLSDETLSAEPIIGDSIAPYLLADFDQARRDASPHPFAMYQVHVVLAEGATIA